MLRCALPAALLLSSAPAAQAQRLLTLVPGVAEASSADGPGPSIGPVPTAVQVDLGLLRSAPSWLEVPTPDGSVLSAERSVFEDRGGGDLMWSGGHPDAGYDAVVLTVEGGRLVGRFGAAGGGAYQIHAAADGRGGMAPVGGPRPEGVPFCEAETVPEAARDAAAHVRSGSRTADLPAPVSNPQSHDRLDILVAYTATAARNWGGHGEARSAIRHAGDYLKMVFRNNRLPVEPRIVHIARAPAALDRVGRDRRLPVRSLWGSMRDDGVLLRLRHEHRADLVHLFSGERMELVEGCGRHTLLGKGGSAGDFHAFAYGWTTNAPMPCNDYVATFAHEIGHGLGAHHDPANVRRPEALYRPYAFGHANFDFMPSIGTAMSYAGQTEPFFSTPRIRPWGAIVGIAEEQDNEWLLQETVHIGARYSDYLRSVAGLPAPPSDLRVRLDAGVLHLSWRDNAPEADGYELSWNGGGDVLLEGRTEATIPLPDHLKKQPGAHLAFEVRARKGQARSLRSGVVWLVVPDEAIAAPSGVAVTVPLQLDHVKVRWTDNSENETGFEVQLLREGDPLFRVRVPADSTEAELWPGYFLAQPGAEYRVRVFAFNESGYSESNEAAPFLWEHPLVPGPVTDVAASAIGPTTVRVTWTVDSERVEDYTVRAVLEGWTLAVIRATAYVGKLDFEGLARGGRYRFEVGPRNVAPFGGPRSVTYLTLGERRAGPVAPSDLSLAKQEGGSFVLSWTDNSDDELGFEVQHSSGSGGRYWHRLFLVPPDTESVVYPGSDVEGRLFRVFAWNERGFSSPPVTKRPPPPPEAPTARIGLTADCRKEEDLCIARTDVTVVFEDLSDGLVEERSWEFGDGSRSAEKMPRHSWSVPGFYRVKLEVSGLGVVSSASRDFLVRAGAPAGSCEPDERTLCLQDSRYEVRVGWWAPDGASGDAFVAHVGTNSSGLFRFFDAENWEVLIKVLDGCGVNGRVWVLGASTTDLGYRVAVTDTVTGESRSYGNEPGQPSPAIVDTEAFECAAGAAAGRSEFALW